MIVHRQVALGMLTVLFLAVAVFCASGYSMVASFSVAHPDRDYDRQAITYAAGVLGSLAGALIAGIAAWRADRPRRP
jgi:hypothetical protein